MIVVLELEFFLSNCAAFYIIFCLVFVDQESTQAPRRRSSSAVPPPLVSPPSCIVHVHHGAWNGRFVDRHLRWLLFATGTWWPFSDSSSNCFLSIKEDIETDLKVKTNVEVVEVVLVLC